MASQNTIKCSVCKKLLGTTNVRLKKLIEQYGGKRKLNASYVCRSCKSAANPKTIAKGKIVKIKQKKAKAKKLKRKKLPKSKVICSKCDNAFGSTKTRIDKLIQKFGSLEELHGNYVCTKCRREHNVDMRGRMRRVKNKRKPKLVKGDEPYVLPQHMKFQGDEFVGPEVEYCPRPKGMPVDEYNKILKEHIDDGIKRGVFIPVDSNKKDTWVKPSYRSKYTPEMIKKILKTEGKKKTKK